jgi:hypothetical protein
MLETCWGCWGCRFGGQSSIKYTPHTHPTHTDPSSPIPQIPTQTPQGFRRLQSGVIDGLTISSGFFQDELKARVYSKVILMDHGGF